ncbi:GNAT family N-acetyltransferase [Embleya sp. NPDC008237]|uniref:GNAT family N-acetyltransferase n=1 Tax=Embleya sp. NPDC008237 TaxID=3363978 RepID=UPI0036EE0D9C
MTVNTNADASAGTTTAGTNAKPDRAADERPIVLRAPDTAEQAVEPLHTILAELVLGGAALGWVAPPPRAEVAALLTDLAAAQRAGNASVRFAYAGEELLGFGYWRRYTRPTHRPNADLEKLAVTPSAHGRGVGRLLTTALIEDARAEAIEILTLDARGDNANALHLYRSLGFVEYGRLHDFVAVGSARYDKVFCSVDLRTPPA